MFLLTKWHLLKGEKVKKRLYSNVIRTHKFYARWVFFVYLTHAIVPKKAN